jgi:hypothetical protein
MSYVKFGITAELRKFLRDQPTKVAPEVLLQILAANHLRSAK